MKDLLGGKGANLAEMVNLGIPVPPGFTITTEVCTMFYEKNMQLPEGLREEVLANLKKSGRAHGYAVRRSEEPAFALHTVRRPGEYARYDGHGPQPGPQLHHRKGPHRPHGQRVVRLGLLQALCRHVRRRGPRIEAREQGGRGPLRGDHRREEEGEGHQARHRVYGRGPEGPGGPLQEGD